MKARAHFLTVLLFAQLLLSIAAGLLPYEWHRHAAMLGVMLLPLLLLRRAPRGAPRLRLRPRRSATPLLLLLPAFILFVAATSIGWGWILSLFGRVPSVAEPISPFVLAILLDAAIPAIGEELFARGAVFSVLRPHGRRCAVIGSALIFALMHVNLLQLPYAFIAGLLLGMLYEASGGLLLPILFHFCSNLFSLLLMFGAPAAPLFSGLAIAAVIGAILLAWLRPAPLDADTAGEPGGLRELLLSPLLLWIGIILLLMLL